MTSLILACIETTLSRPPGVTFRVSRSVLSFVKQKRDELLAGARRRSSALSWLGLALMGAQFGVLARLTWWEYSWDIMEPVTYFITYGTTLAMYAYFVLTRQVRPSLPPSILLSIN